MSALKNSTWQRKIRRVAGSILIALAVIFLFRNPLAKFALIQLAPLIVGIDLQVGEVRIGSTAVEITGIRIHEPEATHLSQLETAYVRIAFTIEDGFRRSCWAKRVTITRPTLHLRFDAAGKLISKFPESRSDSHSPVAIPVRELLVRDATIVVHQTGKQPFAIGGMELVGQFGDSLRVRGELPELFGGRVVMQADLNAKTLAGHSTLSIENISVDSEQINELPLIPDSIHPLGLSATFSGSAVIEHPSDALNFSQYQAKLVSVLTGVHSTKHGPILDQVQCTATKTNGAAQITIVGNPLSGRIDVSLLADLNQTPLSADATLSIQACELRAIARELFPDFQLVAKTDATATSHLTFENQQLAITGKINATANSISVSDVPVDDVNLTLAASGLVSIGDLASMSGSIHGTVESQGIAVSDVASRLQLPAATGRIAGKVGFIIPLESITDTSSYSVDGNVRATGVSMSEFALTDSTVRLEIENATAKIAISDAIVFDPQSNQVLSFAANTKAELSSLGNIAAGVEVAFSPTPALIHALGISDLEPTGRFRLTASAQNRLDRAAFPETWTAKTIFHGTDLTIVGESIGTLRAECELADGNFVVPQFEVPWRNNKFVASVNGSLVKGLALETTVYSNSIQIEDIAELATRMSKQQLMAAGIARAGGVVRVKIPDWNLNSIDIRGGGQASISAAHFATTKIGGLDLTWEANPTGLKLRSDSRDFFGGRFVVDATMQNADWTTTVLQGQFEGVQASRLAALSKSRLPVTGVFDGGMEIREIGNPDSAKGHAWISSRGISTQRIPVEISNSLLTLDSGIIDFTSDGSVSQGRFDAKARTTLQGLLAFANSPHPRIEQIPVIVSAKLSDVPISELQQVASLPKELRTLNGKLSATVERGMPMLDGHKICDLTCTLENLQLNQVRLSDRIVGEITIQHERASLDRLTGRLADGRLSGRADLSLSANPTGTFEFAANRMSLRRLGNAVARDQDLSGSGSVEIRGKFGQLISGHVDLNLDHGSLAGVSVREAKFPVDWSYSQPSRTARWQCRAGSVSLGGGKVRVASEGSYGSSLNMSTDVRIERVDSSKLIAGKSIGAGTITGNVNINAKRARSPKQFTGRFDLELANPKALELPVLNQIPTVVSLTPSRPGVGADGGFVEGRLAGGLVHVDQLAIVQSNVQVLMSGNTTHEGRLDFDVTVNTNANGPADQLLELANTPLMLAAPAPVALIAKANDLLKDRVVHVHVGGIATRPTVQLQPGKQLSQNAVKFFLSNTLGSQATEIATRRSPTQRR